MRGGIGRAGCGRGGRGFSIGAVVFDGVPDCWGRFGCCCCLHRSDDDSEACIFLGSGRVMRSAPSASAMSSNITCMGAMYATLFFELQARTCPQTRPWSLSMTQAPESPPTVCVSCQSMLPLKMTRWIGGENSHHIPPKLPTTCQDSEEVYRPWNLTRLMAGEIVPPCSPLVRPREWTLRPPSSSSPAMW